MPASRDISPGCGVSTSARLLPSSNSVLPSNAFSPSASITSGTFGVMHRFVHELHRLGMAPDAGANGHNGHRLSQLLKACRSSTAATAMSRRRFPATARSSAPPRIPQRWCSTRAGVATVPAPLPHAAPPCPPSPPRRTCPAIRPRSARAHTCPCCCPWDAAPAAPPSRAAS